MRSYSRAWDSCHVWLAVMAGLVCTAAAARDLHAQESGRSANLLFVAAGGYAETVTGDRVVPSMSLRYGRVLTQSIIAEAEFGYAPTFSYANTSGGGGIRQSTPVTFGALSLQVHAPWRVAPFASFGVGRVRRGPSAMLSTQIGYITFIGGGVRAYTTERVFLQGELRLRQDYYPFGSYEGGTFQVGAGLRL